MSLSRMQWGRRLEISHAQNIRSVFELRVVAFHFFAPNGGLLVGLSELVVVIDCYADGGLITSNGRIGRWRVVRSFHSVLVCPFISSSVAD